MALPTEDEEWVRYLSLLHDAERDELEGLNSYYEGTMGLSYMHPEVLREVQDRIRPVVIAWPQLVVDALEERLDVVGFRLPEKDEDEVDFRRVWQANDMDEQSQMGTVDALVMRRSYITVGTNEDDDDTPLVSAESPLEVFADIDPRTRKVRAALRRVIEPGTFARDIERSATLYLPDRTVWYDWTTGSWSVNETDEHKLGDVPVVPLINRHRLSTVLRNRENGSSIRRIGRSELDAVIPLSDAANKIATDMMVAAEFLALPVRGLFGVGPDDLKDKDGNNLSAIQTLLKRLLTIPVGTDEGVKEFEFPGANLSGFHESINSLARLVASLAGLPPHYLGFTTENPASADAIRSAESRLVRRAERKQRAFGGSYEQVMRLVRRFQTGETDPGLKLLETVWADASTPTVAQKADAAVKLYTTTPKPIITLRQTRRDLGKTDTEIANMEREDEEEARRDPIGQIARSIVDDREGPGAQPLPVPAGAGQGA